jgi:peptide/nickel transport system substrate-binding protein
VKVHKGRALIAAASAILLGLTACSSSSGGGSGSGDVTAGTAGSGAFSDCASKPTTCNSGTPKKGGSLTYVLEKTIVGWNQVYSPSNVFEIAEVEDGILPGVYLAGSDLKPFLNTNMMVSAEQTKANPQTLVYKIKPDAVWSDGKPINVDDFNYMKDVSDGTTCPKCGAATSAGYSQIKSITGSDNGKTVTVVMKTPFADWQSMFSVLLPAHIAAANGGTSGAANLNASFQWFDKNVPNYSGGPYIISNYQKDTSITEVPNPKWYGSPKPSLDKLVFKIITDQTQEPTALQNKEVQAIYPQPNADLVNQTKSIPGTQHYLGKGLVWEHFDFNEKNQFLKDKVLRTAIFTAIDRKAIIARTIGQFVPGAQPLNNHIYVPGQAGYQDNVTATKQGSGDVAAAKKMLTDAGYTGVGSTLKTKSGTPVAFRCTYSEGNKDRQTECEVAQNTLQQLGIKVTLKTTSDLGELGTGDFDMIVFAWVGSPFVVAGAQQIYELKGGADYGFNNDPAAEKLINEAAQSTDQAKVEKLMNQADSLITKDAYELPLYQKPTYLDAYNNVVNIRDNATSSGPPVNVQEWGIKST